MNILKNFDHKELEIINIIKDACANFNITAYIVGGAIRDSILKVKPKDIDICIEADPMYIIKKLEFVKSYKYYEKFQTSTVLFENGIEIDLIRCRKEKYDFNGDLPKITPSNVYDDLFRRDFTCNAIAYDIINDTLIDPFNGLEDIENRIVRKIHANSYMEDPTRIFRAIKYANRYDFKIYDEDEIKRDLSRGAMNNISKDRIIREIISLCNEDNWIENISLCKNFNIFNINKNMLLNKGLLCNYKDVNDKLINLFLSLENNRIMFINNSIILKDIRKAFKNYDEHVINKEYLSDIEDNFTISDKLKNLNIYDIKILAFFHNNKYKILNYISNLKNIKLDTNGNCLDKLGLDNKKKYKDILSYLYMIKLNTGIIDDKEYLHKNLGEILDVVKYKN